MAKKKKKCPKEFGMKTLKPLKMPLGLAGASVGASITGGAIDKTFPSVSPSPVTRFGTTSAKFIRPVTTLAMGKIMVSQVEELKYKKRRKNKCHN